VSELKEVLSKYASISDELWDRVLANVDEDGSGKLNLDEFIIMMRNVFI
jgi:Ca2+-binding EF-hand superfamily protein